jgi:hypothetical protein
MAPIAINKTRLIWAGVVAVALVTVFFAGWWFKPVQIVYQQQQIDSIRSAHRIDSIRYAYELEQAQAHEAALTAEIVLLDAQIAELKQARHVKATEIINLPATETVQLFSHNTGDSARITVIEGDTGCIVKLPSIRLCNLIFADRNGLISENGLLKTKVETYDAILAQKEVLLGLTYKRIEIQTAEYFKSQGIINKQQFYITKIGRKVRNRNIIIGILGGVAVGAIGAAILVN